MLEFYIHSLAWYRFSSWPHSDITSLGRSVTWPRLFFTAEMLLGKKNKNPPACISLEDEKLEN